MFKRLHRQLTIVSTIITGIITAIVMLSALRISENGLIRNHFGTFLANVSSCITYIDKQREISIDWLSRMEFNYQFLIYVEDTGSKLLYSELRATKERTALFQEARKKADSENLIQFTPTNSGRISFQEINFTLTLQNQSRYYTSIFILPKDTGYLTVIILHPLHEQRHQIMQQRFLFGGLFFLAVTLLFAFSWFFIRRVLRPVEENRKKQIEFVASASHELRTPLSVILANLSALDSTEFDSGDDTKHQFFSHIRNACKRMSSLINDMLTLASADSGNWSMNRSPVSLDTVLLDAFESYEIIAEKKKQTLEVILPNDHIPLCLCDRDRIFQALSIFLNNAIEYTPFGGFISLSLLFNNQFEIHIADNGPGIPDEDKEKIFNRFYRGTVSVDSSSSDGDMEKSQHFGLGLCIAAEIIQIHHGTLEVTDTPGGGTTFIIRLKK